MKTIQVSVLVAGVLCLAGVVNADIVAIQHTMDYQDNDWLDGIWFVEPGAILDHSPYCRAATEDWGWTHVVTDRIPAGATGIQSAAVTIIGWNINVEAGGDHVIYALPEKPGTTSYAKINGIRLGMLDSAAMSPISVPWSSEGQIYSYDTLWSTTTFDLPAEALDDLWANGQVCFYMDIEQSGGDGMRVTLESAVLRINYIAPTPTTPSLVNVHRFWSPTLAAHFYTASEEEAQAVIDNYSGIWGYEGIVFSTLADDTDTMAVPVHRFWSPILGGHFYTANQYEAEYVMINLYGVWGYEGVVFHAYPADYQPVGTQPVYRFWSPLYGHHFYTADAKEKEYVIANYPDSWTYEGVAWNAFAYLD